MSCQRVTAPGSVTRRWVVVFHTTRPTLRQPPSRWQMRHRSRLRSRVLHGRLGIHMDVSQTRKSHQNIVVPDKVVVLMFLVSPDMVLIKRDQRLRLLCYVSVWVIFTFAYSPPPPPTPTPVLPTQWHVHCVLTVWVESQAATSHWTSAYDALWGLTSVKWGGKRGKRQQPAQQARQRFANVTELSEQWWHKRTGDVLNCLKRGI